MLTTRTFQENQQKFLEDFRRDNSKTVIHIRKIKSKSKFAQKILCSEMMNWTQNGFPNNPETIGHSVNIS